MDEVTVNFPSMYELLDDLKLMGERNAAFNRPSMLTPSVLPAAAAIYQGVGL